MIPALEYGAAYVELVNLGVLRVYGEDAQSFLHSQLTSDVKGLGPGESQYSCWCSPKGRVLANGVLWQRASRDFLWFFPNELLAKISSRLRMFILRAKAKIEDVTPDFRRFGVGGPASTSTINALFGESPLDAGGIGGAVKLPGQRHLVVLPVEQTEPWLSRIANTTRGASPSEWAWLSIHSGDPWIGAATQDLFVPQMLNIDLLHGISFTKGCYPGQEIVARMHYLGKLKERLYLAHVSSESAPEAGAKLYSPHFGQQVCGSVINAAAAPGGGFDILAVVQIAAADTAHLHGVDGPPLTVLPLPYSVPQT